MYSRYIFYTLLLICIAGSAYLSSISFANKTVSLKPRVELKASQKKIVLPCPPGAVPQNCTPTDTTVTLTAIAKDFKGRNLSYVYNVTGGSYVQNGSTAMWNLAGQAPGTYTATVSVEDNHNNTAFASVEVTIEQCQCTKPQLCVTISTSCPASVKEGKPIIVTASVGGVPEGGNVTYNWSVNMVDTIEGNGTSNITIDTKNLGGKTVTSTVEIGGVPPECPRQSSCSTDVTK